MAWELQSHMIGNIAPSVHAYLSAEEDPAAECARILGYTRLDASGDDPTVAAQDAINVEVRAAGWASFVSEITEHAAEVATTDNGGHMVHLDSGGWCSVPWCSEDVAAGWYG